MSINNPRKKRSVVVRKKNNVMKISRSSGKTFKEVEKTCAIRVCARFRPINKREREESLKSGIEEKDFCPLEMMTTVEGKPALEITLPKRKKPFLFAMDDIFWMQSQQDEVFLSVGRNTCKDALKGYNGCIFAFGQTGSGKTYTMYGPENWKGKPIQKLDADEMIEYNHQMGIIPRCMNFLFDELRKAGQNKGFTVEISCVEIYITEIRDLLQPAKRIRGGHRKLKIREHQDGSTKVEGAHIEKCENMFDVLKVITKAKSNRTVSAHRMNATSSRSHSIMQVNVEQVKLDGEITKSKLNFVDLAGSEKVKKIGAKGHTMKESQNINKTLLMLGNVINALSKGAKFVPFRDCDLTYLLKDSLGGNTKTNLIICCSPHIWNVQESLSTLQFGVRCKLVKNKVKKNRLMSPVEMQELIKRLREEIRVLKAKLANAFVKGGLALGDDEKDNLRKSASAKESRIPKEVVDELQSLKSEIAGYKRRQTLHEREQQSLREQLGKSTQDCTNLMTELAEADAKFQDQLKAKEVEMGAVQEKYAEMRALTLGVANRLSVCSPLLSPQILSPQMGISSTQLGVPSPRVTIVSGNIGLEVPSLGNLSKERVSMTNRYETETPQQKRERQLIEMKMGLMRAHSDHSEMTIEKQNTSLQDKNHQLKVLMEKTDRLAEQKRKLNRRNMDYMDKLRKKDKQILAYDNQVSNLESALEASQQRISSLEANIEKLRDQKASAAELDKEPDLQRRLLEQQKYLNDQSSIYEADFEAARNSIKKSPKARVRRNGKHNVNKSRINLESIIAAHRHLVESDSED